MATFSGGEEITSVSSISGAGGSYTVPAGSYAKIQLNGGKHKAGASLSINGGVFHANGTSSGAIVLTNNGSPAIGAFSYNQIILSSGDVFSWASWENFHANIREFNNP